MPGATEALTTPEDAFVEPVEVESGEAAPSEPETIAVEEENREQLPAEALLGTLEGMVSVKVDNRPDRPLTNQLVLIYNRATGERFQAYTDNQGYYSRRVPEGRYIVQIRQRISAPFVRQRLASVQSLRRTAANVNVSCAGIISESSDRRKAARI
jgi:hypothetical protein